MDQLAHKAVLEGEFAKVTPRSTHESPRKQTDIKMNVPPIVHRLKLSEGQDHVFEERVMDMPKVSPRHVPQPQSLLTDETKQMKQPKIEHMDTKEGQFYDRKFIPDFQKDRREAEYLKKEAGFGDHRVQDRGRILQRGQGHGGLNERDHGHRRSRSYEQDRKLKYFGDGLEKFQWARPRPILSPVEVRRSRSLSPVLDRPVINVEERKRQLQELQQEIEKVLYCAKLW